ncbi:MAG: P-loop containing nucleoside triphosphate hydrolase protein [Monoraphidium minutum]|nr:MAG: P-loop containing nucleoside triphosphate hydrolase protein [Monoraphidium minutum]
MALSTDSRPVDLAGIQVCVRVRPLNPRERDEGLRSCVAFDEPTRQVVLQAVDKDTLMQLRGCTAKGFAFDRRFGVDSSADDIYDSCVAGLVENLFRGYNATVLAYGQTGSGKTHTMSGGVGIHGMQEEGITRRAARHIFSIVDGLKARLKPGEAVSVAAYALELYNEDLRDLSKAHGQGGGGGLERRGSALLTGGAPPPAPPPAVLTGGATPRDRCGGGAGATPEEVRIAERPVGRDGRVVPEVVGVQQVGVEDAEGLIAFFSDCCDHRSVASTKMNDRSSRSHAIYTVVLRRTTVDVSEDGGKARAARGSRVRTTSFESKFHLVDLAGSERVKRSGVTGQAFKEATHINSGLLALGNVIVALSEPSAPASALDTGGAPATAPAGASGAGAPPASIVTGGGGGGGGATARRPHIPYRDSKLTRLLQDSLGGNSLTALISCISCCEADFEETANTLKYANRACRIKNTPLPARYTTLEEDLLPMLPEGGAGVGMVQIQALLEDHAKLKEMREKREADKKATAENRLTELRAMREAESKKPGYQRLRIMQYDELRRKLTSSQGLTVGREAPTAAARTNTIYEVVPSVASAGTAVDECNQTSPSAAASPHLIKAWQEGSEGGEPAPAAAADAGDATAGPRGGCEDAGAQPEPAQQRQPEARRQEAARRRSTADAAAAAAAASLTAGPLAAAISGGGAAPGDEGRGSGGGFSPFAQLEFKPREGADAAAAAAPEPAAAATTTEAPAAAAPPPQLLARFRVNKHDSMAVFMAASAEDFRDVVGLLPANSALPASDKMSYLLGRLEVNCGGPGGLQRALASVAAGASMGDAVGPAVGCLMATMGTSLITDCIFDFEDPQELEGAGPEQRLELWGLQIPHNLAVRPALVPPAPDAGAPPAPPQQQHEAPPPAPGAAAAAAAAAPQDARWSSADRLNVSVGLLYALCAAAQAAGARVGFCVPRPQLLKRWLQAGVRMRQVEGPARLIYPPSAHDYMYYRGSTVAYFLVPEVKASLEQVLSVVHEAA